MSANEILALLIRQEMALSAFYAEAATRFPETEPVWMELAGEERAHAEVLRELDAGALEASTTLDASRFNAAAVRSSMEFIERKTAQLREGSVTEIQALSFAVGMEESLLEHKFFEVFRGDGARVRTEFEALAAHTRGHLSRVRALWESRRAGG